MIDVIIIEDNQNVQKALSTLLKKAGSYNLLAAYFDLQSARAEKNKLKPALIILDLALPDSRGPEAIAVLREMYPLARIAIYTAYENESDIIACVVAGANGYIMKDTPYERLLNELQVIYQGGSTLTPRVAEKLLKQLNTPKMAETNLTGRELEVLNLISLGLKYEDIAEALGISAHTVRHHIEKIYKKMNVNSRGQAVAQAVRSGIIMLK